MRLTKICLGIAILLPLTHCASTKRAEVGTVSPFLGDVRAQLRRGSETEAQLIYKNPRANLARYNKILLDSLQFIGAKDSELAKTSAEDRRTISQYAYKAFRDELSKSYEIVSTPQPNTLRIRIAVTDAEPSSVVLDTVTTYIPQARLISNLGELVTGDPPFVGKINAEGRISDAMTNELLVAGADARQGAKDCTNPTNSWTDVERNMQYFAQRFRYNLCKAQQGKNCELPEDDKSLL